MPLYHQDFNNNFSHNQFLFDKKYQKSIDLSQDNYAYVYMIKQMAFGLMDKLEGWCSKNKASILIDFIFLMQPTTIVEIGVWGGKSLIPMALALKMIKNGKIYGIDPWDNAESIKGMQNEHLEWWSKVDHKIILQGLQNKIQEFELDQQVELIASSSADAPDIYNIDILHIDGNHSPEASMFDLNKWVPLVRKGGIIIFDDTNWESTRDAAEWLDKHCLKFNEYIEENSWGVWIKI